LPGADQKTQQVHRKPKVLAARFLRKQRYMRHVAHYRICVDDCVDLVWTLCGPVLQARESLALPSIRPPRGRRQGATRRGSFRWEKRAVVKPAGLRRRGDAPGPRRGTEQPAASSGKVARRIPPARSTSRSHRGALEATIESSRGESRRGLWIVAGGASPRRKVPARKLELNRPLPAPRAGNDQTC